MFAACRKLNAGNQVVRCVLHCSLSAAEVAEEINSFISRAAALTNNEGGAAQQADDGNEAPAGSKRSRKSAGRANQPPRLELLKQLHSSLAAGKQAGILAQLDQEQLRQLLLLLLDHVRLGQDRLIEDQDTVSSRWFLLEPAALDMDGQVSWWVSVIVGGLWCGTTLCLRV